MSFIVTNLGEEFETLSVWKPSAFTKPGTVEVGLYHDATDGISDPDDLGAITTEPSGASYSRQSVSIDSTDITISKDANGNWQALFKDITFDLSDSSQTVDGYFVVANFQASETGDSSAQDHLIFTGALDQEYNASNIGGTLTVQDAGRAAD